MLTGNKCGIMLLWVEEELGEEMEVLEVEGVGIDVAVELEEEVAGGGLDVDVEGVGVLNESVIRDVAEETEGMGVKRCDPGLSMDVVDVETMVAGKAEVVAGKAEVVAGKAEVVVVVGTPPAARRCI